MRQPCPSASTTQTSSSPRQPSLFATDGAACGGVTELEATDFSRLCHEPTPTMREFVARNDVDDSVASFTERQLFFKGYMVSFY